MIIFFFETWQIYLWKNRAIKGSSYRYRQIGENFPKFM